MLTAVSFSKTGKRQNASKQIFILTTGTTAIYCSA